MSLVDELIAGALPYRPGAFSMDTDRLNVSLGDLRALVSAALEVRGVPREPTKAMLLSAVRVLPKDDATVRGDQVYGICLAFHQLLCDAAPAKGDTPSVVRDALRLDWLERQPAVRFRRSTLAGIATVEVRFGGWAYGDTVREAIDAALAPAGEPNGQKT